MKYVFSNQESNNMMKEICCICSAAATAVVSNNHLCDDCEFAYKSVEGVLSNLGNSIPLSKEEKELVLANLPIYISVKLQIANPLAVKARA